MKYFDLQQTFIQPFCLTLQTNTKTKQIELWNI